MKKSGPVTGFLSVLFFVMFTLSGIALADDLIEKGLAQFRAENYEEALLLLKEAREADPKSSPAAFYLGLTYKQVGDFREAIRNYRDAVSLVPSIKDAYIELIEMLYNINEFGEAKEWANKAEALGIKPANAAFLRGLILLKENKNRDAITAFAQSKERDKSFTQPADFQIALALAKERRLSDARKTLKAVIAISPDSELASFAKEYESALAKSLEEYRQWRFAVGAGCQYDTNIISKPSVSLGPGIDDLPGKKGSGISNTFRIDFAPMPDGPWFSSAQYNLSTNNYLGNHTYKYDILSQTISLTPGYNFDWGALTAHLSYNHIWLSEDEYMSVFSLKPSFNVVTQSGLIWQLSGGYGKRKMLKPSTDPDENRDGEAYTFSAGYIYPFDEGKGMFNLKYEYSLDGAKGNNWDNNGSRLSLVLLMPLKEKINLMFSGDAFIQKYANHNTFTGALHGPGFPDTPTKRLDKTYTASAGILWELLKTLNLNINYTFTRADSNFAVYDYSRNMFSAGLEYSF